MLRDIHAIVGEIGWKFCANNSTQEVCGVSVLKISIIQFITYLVVFSLMNWHIFKKLRVIFEVKINVFPSVYRNTFCMKKDIEFREKISLVTLFKCHQYQHQIGYGIFVMVTS